MKQVHAPVHLFFPDCLDWLILFLCPPLEEERAYFFAHVLKLFQIVY